MAESCLLGLQGKDNIYECAYVESSLIPELSYFASKVQGHVCRKITCGQARSTRIIADGRRHDGGVLDHVGMITSTGRPTIAPGGS